MDIKINFRFSVAEKTTATTAILQRCNGHRTGRLVFAAAQCLNPRHLRGFYTELLAQFQLRKKQYGYYRNKLLSFEKKADSLVTIMRTHRDNGNKHF